MKIDYLGTGGRITFDASDWVGGVDYLNISDTLERGTTGLAYVESFNPYRTMGFASPSYNPGTATNDSAISAYLRQGFVSGSNTAYAVENGAKIHQITGLTGDGTVTNTGSFPHTITPSGGTSTTGNDFTKYYLGSTEYGWYTYSSSTVWDIGRFDLSTTFDDTYMTVTANNKMSGTIASGGAGYPHPLISYENNKLYVGDRNFVHMFDGQSAAAGDFTAQVLILPNDYIITAFVRYNFYLAIFAYKKVTTTGDLSQADVFFWDTFSQSFTFSQTLNDSYISEAINYKNSIMCFTSGLLDDIHSGNLRIKLYNGDVFETIATYSSTSGSGGSSFVSLPIRGGVQTQGNDVFFNAGGKIFKLNNNGESWTLNEFFSDFSNSTPGILKFFGQTFNLFFSNGSGSSTGLRTLRSGYNTAAAYSKVAELDVPARKQARPIGIEVYYSATTTGSSGRTFELHYLSDQTDYTVRSDVAVPAAGAGIASSAIERYEYDSSGTVLAPFKTMQLLLKWLTGNGSTSAPLVSKVIVYFEFKNIGS